MTTTEAKTNTYVVLGPPGTGKTTYLAQETHRLIKWADEKYAGLHKRPVLLCSLTRAAAAEIAGRDLPIASDCVGTLHSHAYRSLGCPMVAEKHLDDFNQTCPDYKLTTGKKTDTDDPMWDRNQTACANKWHAQYHLYRAQRRYRKFWPVRVQSFAKEYEAWKQEANVVDFTDMIELAYQEIPAPPGDPLVLIADEAQDLSALEYALLQKWGQATGRLIITGDPYQALYVWRGAHPEIFLDPSIPSNRRKILSQSYRVPRAVHAASVRWIEQLSNYQAIDYHPRDYDGSIGFCRANWKAPRAAIELAEEYLAKGKTVMMISSCSFLLNPLLKEIRRRGLPFANPWRAKRGDWNPLQARRGTNMAQRILDFLRLDKPTCGEDYRLWTAQELHHWIDVLGSNQLFQRGAKARLARIAKEREPHRFGKEEMDELFVPEPFVELLKIFLSRERGNGVSLNDLLGWWETRLLPSKQRAASYPLTVAHSKGPDALRVEPTLYVGTAHSFKGSQADVVIVFPDLSPAGFREWMCPGAHRDSVIRMGYVALTRARETVMICNPASASHMPMRRLLCQQ